ncbi:MAG TPA: DNA polymerase Y family protein [Dehalococcoidia bacterium]|nr:DNA polymerase Y family protein [Dehalococcoidia bacterium]
MAGNSTRQVACLLISHFAMACELAERPELRGHPVVLGGGDAGPRVVDLTDEALRYGIDPGISLREAIALCPALTVIEPRPALYDDMFDDTLDALHQVSPIVERGGLGVTYADLTGLERLYGPRLPEALLVCAPPMLAPRLGIAWGKFPALAAAAFAEPGTPLLVPRSETAGFLSPQSVDLLPLPSDAHRRLRMLDIRTVGAFAALPRSAVQAQFGATGALAWDLAHGNDDRPLDPEPHTERIVEVLEFAPPLTGRDAVLMALEQMLVRALRQPGARNRFARGLFIRAATERGRSWSRRYTLKEPSSDRVRLAAILRTLVEYAEFPGALLELRLELTDLTREGGQQAQLFRERTRVREELETTLRQLKTRYGHCPVGRVVEVEPWSRVPERRMALVDYDP